MCCIDRLNPHPLRSTGLRNAVEPTRRLCPSTFGTEGLEASQGNPTYIAQTGKGKSHYPPGRRRTRLSDPGEAGRLLLILIHSYRQQPQRQRGYPDKTDDEDKRHGAVTEDMPKNAFECAHIVSPA